ncbi:coproporphyrinogen III oxidase family protein [Collinsella sp. AF05-8-2]|uniref:radical SAM family heme chaperone HemW n=1 Tax=unclassified Collinsella TaxID=2637548 RepID=UPI000E510F32|nr:MULTISPECIES: radical SAM family heme chaperone HemW [unclassified Collinsella]RGW94656.1 coproporphyrinogen III oxidase family protein [Collinsella sp. AF05-9]RGW95959.1 coproporphyrinogen III oxidase family protein [Collinsella sp. AF05-8-2]
MAVTALYVHVPFCAQKCRYCDFDSRSFALCDLDAALYAYFEQLYARLDAFGNAGALRQIRTVYVGGGTPSLAGERLVILARRISMWCKPVEFTCEANPESLTAELVIALAKAGVTRVSLGVQTLDNNELTVIGRIHNAERALEAIATVKDAGLDVSCDLMCGLPGQTATSWQRTLDGVLAAAPHHVSVYPLTLEEGTPLYRMACRDESLEPDEDFQASCMDAARERLGAAGYHPYEVASYALDGHECAHNIAYWTGRGYLGLGRSAAGMLDAEDFDCLAGLFPGVAPRCDFHRVRLVQRNDDATAFDAEYLSQREAAAEDLMLACRMTRGVASDLLVRAARVIPADELTAACDRALELGLATWVPEHGDNHTGPIVSVDVIAGRTCARLAPTHLGWLDGNVLFELFWGLA